MKAVSSRGLRPDGRAGRREKPLSQTVQDAERAALLILLELFEVVDYVFSEPDAFMEPRKKLRLIYERWKLIRIQLDPDFDPHRYRRNGYD